MSQEDLFSLKKKISLANQAYSEGQPFLTDEEYDKLWQQLRDLEPSAPQLWHTAKPDPYKLTVPHLVPMPSLDKAFSTPDLRVFMARFSKKQLLLQPKYDGIAVALYPQPDGSLRLIKAGDGYTGEEITHHLEHISEIPDSFSGPMLSCEALIRMENWSPEFGANPRNTVAGLLNRKSLADRSPLPKISLIPHDYISRELSPSDWSTYEELETLLLRQFDSWKEHFPLDGIVFKVKDSTLRAHAGSKGGIIPRWAIAWKPPVQTAETTVTEIEWNISRQGRLVPTIIYEPLTLCGTVNTRATGNNADWLATHKIGPGSKIKIAKAGEIIPQVLEVLETPYTTEDYPHLEVCPSCGEPLQWGGVHLWCVGLKCEPQLLKRLCYFYSRAGIEIPHLAERMISQVLADSSGNNILQEHPWAFLEPDNFQLTPILQRVCYPGDYYTYLDNLGRLDPALPQDKFISGLGYADLSRNFALYLLQAINGMNPESEHRPSHRAIASFSLALKDMARASEELETFHFAPVPSTDLVNYAVTGELSVTRDEFSAEMMLYNWRLRHYISSKTHYLIVGELSHETKKYQAAKRRGIPIITEAQARELVTQGGNSHATAEESNH